MITKLVKSTKPLRFQRRTKYTSTITIKMNTAQPTPIEAAASVTAAAAAATEPASEELGTSHRKPKSPSGAKLTEISLKLFPLPVTESFKDYWNNKPMLEVQHELLSTLPFYPEPSLKHSSEVINFKSANSLVFPDINEFYVKPLVNTSKNPKHLIIIHGYGAGLGFFIKNIESIAEEHPDWHIHAIDLPGYGCSTRVNFPFRIPNENYQTVEKLFTIPLRDWYLSNGIDENNSITVAHSMGGYLSLLLQINEVNGNKFINKEEFEFLKSRFGCDTALKEKFETQFNELSKPEPKPYKFWDTLVLVSPGGIYSKRSPEDTGHIPTWFVKLWNRNVSPFSLVRNSGPLGSLFVSGWTSRRFSISSLFNNENYKLFHNYAYSIFNAKGSGEYMLNYLLAPGGIPRHPLVNRLEEIKNHSNKTVWLYGGNDWMDPNGGLKSCEKLDNASLEMVPDAGHHIYLDNFIKFNQIIGREMSLFDQKRQK